MDLIIFTTRRPFKKAFFKLKIDPQFTEEMLLDTATYADYANYRKIELQHSRPEGASRNLIFYRESNAWRFKSPDFFDQAVTDRFTDNTVNIGRGRPNKDSTLRYLSEYSLPATLEVSDLTILNVYDVFFCPYGETIEEEIVLGLDESFFKISMSASDIDDASFDYFIGQNLVVVHKDTLPKARSTVSQGKVFINQMKIGDYFHLCRGNQKLVLIGRIVSDSTVCELGDYGEKGYVQRKFEIIKEGITDKKYEGEGKWWTPKDNSTVIQIPDLEFPRANTILFAPYFGVSVQKGSESISVSDDEITNIETNNLMSLNQILYGPPGTGKTFHSINQAVAIIENEKVENIALEQRKSVKKRFDDYLSNGQIVFCTFHQSLGYEDFIEGIKPIESASEEGQISYGVEDGIFKKLCTEAAFSFVKKRSNTATAAALDFSTAYDLFVDAVNESLAKGVKTEIPTRSGGNVRIDSVSGNNNLYITHPDGTTKYTVSKRRLSKIALVFPDLNAVTNINAQFRAEIGGSNTSAYWAVLNAIRQQVLGNTKHGTHEDISEREYAYDDKKEIIKSLKAEDYQIDQPKKFVLIIDEINRGNVSQIFGELITLIEEDKRLGKDEALKAVLPYSKENFGVPPNLYIIGTMNTADRSVEALDTALRRRFSFVPKMPEEAQLGTTTEGLNLGKILLTINTRLRVLKDHDHTIGHAWLWSVSNLEELQTTFGNKILPLLQEYFYNDYEKLGLVLGDRFFNKPEQVSSNIFAQFSGGNDLAGQYNQSWQYELKPVDELKLEDFQSLESLTKPPKPNESN